MIAKIISIALFCYFLFFRCYAVCSLFYSFIIQTPNESLVRNTNNGYQLTIFQLEFYFLLIIIYGLRPSRFSKIIVKSYKEGGTEKFSKKSFFWIVYIGVLLAVFGIPLLIFKNALGNIAEVITTANQYIIENTGLLTMALIFLGLNMLGFYYDFINAFHYAKIQFFRLLLAFMLTLPISAFLYLISVVLKMKADVLIIICLAFNLSFLYLALMALRKQGSQKNNASALKF
ncbi:MULTISPECIES: hypothetical protein [Chryseobacterium]|uniref:Magnesium-transporting ATPase (P-type) n=1 Tax=Chryseobacterium camelliae TaxID=1265445 RepID=A0ABU0THX9_9FLAO|nr:MULTISPECIES: hypothetical protein [Chryseobacterium]MDQ1096664.1 magnesium-transporting ATPase (P-type) [Chryseobacterium camelliae]MDQ1100608.1 magnesium-transporting ATPase (P-type) [Chryseobacterium sp. SORGH_AS_1048]MDR6087946.1 magnesium-transporting ATPase (P-type) [Chryseobacterium sp. SORGH_AS_0909]MDR6132320.1 magnesium-transporting ATPase (P-type) [Chryseobacterium sp. SORGH_AS_1175]